MVDHPLMTRDLDSGVTGAGEEADPASQADRSTDTDSGAGTDTGTTAPQSAADVGPEVARASWAEAAREQLIETAGRYQAVTTYKELGEGVQQRSGIRTKQLLHYWISDVLLRVAKDCAARGEPNLSSLCVNAAGSVGEGYRVAVAATTGEQPTDPDSHAARVRLECYRWFGADMPASGGAPALTARLAATRTRTRKAAHEARPVPTCPTCNLALTASGACDNCD